MIGGYIGQPIGGVIGDVLRQTHFRYRTDALAVDATPTWGAAEDDNVFDPGVAAFRLRIGVANPSAPPGTVDYELRMSKNGGAYTAITTSSTDGVKSTDAGADADGTPIKAPRLTIPV